MTQMTKSVYNFRHVKEETIWKKLVKMRG